MIMKRELNLFDIQQESIRILSFIDKFCEENDISYSLGYGALIGAIRHKGFIPWDDDIDIVMTRPNYLRFVQLFNKSKYISDNHLKLYAPELENCYFNISHVCDMERTRVRKYYQWTNDDTGMWIDIFPIDNLPEDGGEKLRQQSRLCFNTCGANVPFSCEFPFKRHLKIVRKKILFGMHDRKKEIDNYIRLVNELPQFGSTEFVCNFASPYGKKDIHKTCIFDKYIHVPFENIRVSIIAQYDNYLRNIYDDYMVLPPPSARVRKHSVNKYYWR